MRKLFLLDGMALVYRAHFALIRNPIRNSRGINTSALYGFTNTLLHLLESEQPTHLGVAFDTSAPTPRHEKFPDYKAQRDEMPEELAAAIPHVKRLCQAFRIPVLEIDGYEADDLIGTMARRAEAESDDWEVFMVTPDKDFAQLLSEKTKMWRPGKKGGDHEVIGLADLPRIWGVDQPEKITDLLGLMGDSSDNIPGIPGIGPKTAAQLISRFDSLEGVLTHSDQLKGKQRERVETHADLARLSKDLATIMTDAPIDCEWDALTLSEPDFEAVRELFDEFEFRTLAKRLLGDAAVKSSASSLAADTTAEAEAIRTIADVPHQYRLVTTAGQRRELFAALRAQDAFCFDLETTSLDRFRAEILGIAFSWKAHEGWYLPFTPDLAEPLETVLCGSALKIGHNLKYDLSVLARHELPCQGPFFDTMLAHALLHPGLKHGMDDLAESQLAYRPIKLADLVATAPADDLFAQVEKKRATKDLDLTSVPLEALADYAAEDADVTWQLYELFQGELAEHDPQEIFVQIEAPLLPVLVRMEMEGIRMDPDVLAVTGERLQQRIDELATSIAAEAGHALNLNSPKQLGTVLFDELRLVEKPRKTRTGQYRTDEQTLSALAGKHPIIDLILEYREATKLKSTYIDALPQHLQAVTGRVHTHFHQLIAATGRLASTDPNLQNIPVRSPGGREIRRAFVPRAGCTLLSCDYSQIELRVMAALAADPSMIQAFQEDQDIHTATAAKVWRVAEDEVTPEQRRGAKMVNFGIIYGISAYGLSQRLSIPRSEAAEIIDSYFEQYPAIREFMDRTVDTARQTGYVTTLSGRRRHFPDLQSSNQTIRSNAERAAINTPIQGTAADMIKLAMIRIDHLIRDGGFASRLLLQVHDELIFDLVPAERETLLPLLIEAMETILPLPADVPVRVEHGCGDDWLEAH